MPGLFPTIREGGLALLLGMGAAYADSPFEVSARAEPHEDGTLIRLSLTFPPGHLIYAESLSVAVEPPASVRIVEQPRPARVLDKFSEEEKDLYDRPFDLLLKADRPAETVRLKVHFQGCDDSVCFFPETRIVPIAVGGKAPVEQHIAGVAGAVNGSAGQLEWRDLAGRFVLTGRTAGYLDKTSFLAFLNEARGGGSVEDKGLARWQRLGWLATVLLILVGGAALNLTPCVLPMIPVNLAIIGAGARAGSRARGLALGATYGLGLALAYGGLGLMVVLTGARFGALNASPWFNLLIAAIFVALALAMFDVFQIDFSRFQTRVGSGARGRAHFLAVLAMGIVAALLAGACVAPVLISVLLLSGSLYARGNPLGLLLPFLLGIGMALPWPFAGAGLSFLPRPGKWMNLVKYAFGVFILLMAAYYGKLAWSLFRPQTVRLAITTTGPLTGREGQVWAADTGPDLADALGEALAANRPVFVDFWATWCKNCLAMERTTFRDAEVRERLSDFLVIKYQAERPDNPETKEVLDHFGVVGGLPTYVVLRPAAGPEP